ncbi:hypothetical protein NDU88_005086 [Pleurodeles waltl]|uniref:Uncharacterized protein n=1 Tax=Pleurodeles waltl TaxID=8319 RepID=A0AAV7MVQ5_PLEWA|nr:hypothetical protein NDU88_005086 [Pleurodeles waltl]
MDGEVFGDGVREVGSGVMTPPVLVSSLVSQGQIIGSQVSQAGLAAAPIVIQPKGSRAALEPQPESQSSCQYSWLWDGDGQDGEAFGDGGAGDGEVPGTSADCGMIGGVDEWELDFDEDKREEGGIVDEQESEWWGAPQETQKGRGNIIMERSFGVLQPVLAAAGRTAKL